MIKLIGCSVFKNIVMDFCKNKKEEIDATFIGMENHIEPSNLKAIIKEEIFKAESENKYNKIILLYGLCGNSVEGLSSKLPIYIPKAHDCCTLFLGSKLEFNKNFKDRLSAEWYNSDYMLEMKNIREKKPEFHMNYSNLKLEEYIKKYGEENGRYLFEVFSSSGEKEFVFIKTGHSMDEKNIKELKQEYSKLEVIQGSYNFIFDLLNNVENEEILELKPGEVIGCTYDEEVIKGIF